eukprot:gene11729-biopygen354
MCHNDPHTRRAAPLVVVDANGLDAECLLEDGTFGRQARSARLWGTENPPQPVLLARIYPNFLFGLNRKHRVQELERITGNCTELKHLADLKENDSLARCRPNSRGVPGAQLWATLAVEVYKTILPTGDALQHNPAAGRSTQGETTADAGRMQATRL